MDSPLIPKPRLWQCVTLWLGIDPDKVNIDASSMAGHPVFNESQEFRNRLDVACANAGKDGELRPTDYDAHPQNYSVSLREFAAWVQKIGWEAPPAELLAMADKQAAGNGKRTDPATANIFKTMDGLKWSEVVMMFTEPEAVRIKARGKRETFTYEAMGFKNKQIRTAKPNQCWDTLLVLAIVTNTGKTLTDTVPPQTDFKRRVSRLRDALQEFFGIKDDPIPYATTYNPAFVLTAEEHVIRHAHDQVASDDEDEEDTEALMSQTPGR